MLRTNQRCKYSLRPISRSFVNSPDDIHKFNDRTTGIPILVPANKNLFFFKESDVFELPAQQLLETVYSLTDQNYVGFKHAFTNFEFLARFEVKEAYKSYVDEIVQQNIDTINYVASLKEKFPIIGSISNKKYSSFWSRENYATNARILRSSSYKPRSWS